MIGVESNFAIINIFSKTKNYEIYKIEFLDFETCRTCSDI